jgi:UDP-N-acetylglucosamine 4,6-dehydratase/5-epimerase
MTTAPIDILNGKSILITGGTGSFGSAFVKSILARGQPRKVIVFSRDEQKHHAMKKQFADPRIRFFVGDVRDLARLRLALRGVDLVVHAAAMKHVDLCEYNPLEAINTNISGTVNLIQAALDAGVEKVVGVSTDKAVAPINLYGASKLCMEKLLTAANSYSGDLATRFCAVRYGNVMGSKGSVIPLFREQRAQGRITITDARMTRFWIEMDDAVELVLQALSLMRGGEIFIPKLQAATVAQVANTLAPGVPQHVIGIRPGEKLHECLMGPEECRRAKDLGDLLVVEPEHVAWSREGGERGASLPDEFQYTSDRRDLLLSDKDVEQLLLGKHGDWVRPSEAPPAAGLGAPPLVRLPAEPTARPTRGN